MTATKRTIVIVALVFACVYTPYRYLVMMAREKGVSLAKTSAEIDIKNTTEKQRELDRLNRIDEHIELRKKILAGIFVLSVAGLIVIVRAPHSKTEGQDNNLQENMQGESNLQELINIISRKSGVEKEKIGMDTTVGDDLGVTGEDAEELITEISRKFGMNIDDFNFGKYFNDEPGIFTVHRYTVPLTVGDLANAVSAGKLV